MSLENKYDRLPQAGDFEAESGTETFYLSPKPVPTGMPPFSARHLHREANDVYLDFAVGRGNFEFMARAGIGSVVFITFFFLFVSGFGSWLRKDVQPFWSSWVDFYKRLRPRIYLVSYRRLHLYILLCGPTDHYSPPYPL